MKHTKTFICIAIVLFNTIYTLAQAPNIHYANARRSLTVGSPIMPLVPSNVGGSIVAKGKKTSTELYKEMQPKYLSYSNGVSYLNPNRYFRQIQSMACDSLGNLFIAETNPYSSYACIYIIPKSQQSAQFFAGKSALIYNPTLFSDFYGNIYLNDMSKIRKIKKDSSITTICKLDALNYLSYPPNSTTPQYVGIDKDGNFYNGGGNFDGYFTNKKNNYTHSWIYKLNSTLTKGTPYTDNWNQNSKNPILTVGNWMAFDKNNSLFFFQAKENTYISKLTKDGVLSKLGGGSNDGYISGKVMDANFKGQFIATIDTMGYIYVMQGNGNTTGLIKKIYPNGDIMTFANAIHRKNWDYCTNTAITTDNNNNIYVATFIGDEANTSLSRINLPSSGYIINPALPNGLNFDETTGIISGTPTTSFLSTTFTITGFNEAGVSTSSIILEATQPYKITANTNFINYSNTQEYGYMSSSTATDNSVKNFIFPAFKSIKDNDYINTNGENNTLLPTSFAGANSIVPNVSVFAGTGAEGNFDGNTVFATFRKITSLASGKDNTIYIGQSPDTLRYINTKTNLVGTYGSLNYTTGSINPSEVENYDDGAFRKQRRVPHNYIITPNAMVVNNSNNIFMADDSRSQICARMADGSIGLYAGYPPGQLKNISISQGLVDGQGTNARFQSPTGITCNSSGELFVSEKYGNVVRKIDAGGNVTTFVGKDAQLQEPVGIVADNTNNLYITEKGANKISKINSAGAVSLLAGGEPTAYHDGLGAAAGLNNPTAIAIDANNNLYVLDEWNMRVRKIDAQGNTSTLAYGIDRSAALTVGADGNVYVAVGNQIMQIKTGAKNGYYIEPALPSGLNLDNATGKISGKPFVITPPTDYKIYLFNNGDKKDSSSVLNITTDRRPYFTYPNPVTPVITTKPNVYILQAGVTINSISPVSQLGAIPATIYEVTPNLPNGLTLDPATGIISGTPTTTTMPTVYAIRGYTDGGNNSTTITIGTLAAPNITYSRKSDAVILNQPMLDLYPSVDISSEYIAGAGYSISPTLPAGLNFDTQTGIITGTPTNSSSVSTTSTTYIISCKNILLILGTATLQLKILPAAVTGISVPVINYSSATNNFIQNKAINNLIPTNTGGIVNGTYTGTYAGALWGGYQDGARNQAKFETIHSMCMDAAGNMYVSEVIQGRIRKIGADGTVSTVIQNLDRPYGLKADNNGNLFVVQWGANNVIKVAITTGTILQTYTGFSGPQDIAINKNGLIYVADSKNSVIKMIVSDGTIRPYTTFSNPTGIVVDTANNIYVTDAGNNLIYKVAFDGTVTTVAGSGTASSEDGKGTAASFNNPSAIAIDSSGNLYVVEPFANKIRLITPDGTVSTFAGNGTNGTNNGYTPLTTDGATFDYLTGITVAKDGNVYVPQADGKMVNKIVPVGRYSVEPALPIGLSMNPLTGIISGTATTLVAAANYTIQAKNLGGVSNTATVSIQIASSSLKPVISYISAENILSLNSPMESLNPTNLGGNATSYTCNPALPAGLSLGATTGIISGTPTTASSFTSYIITATNASGTATTAIGISVVQPTASPNIIYKNAGGADNVFVFPLNNAITNFPTPFNSGGKIDLVSNDVITYAGTGTAGNFDNTNPSLATFTQPDGLVFDATGNLYTAEQTNIIRKIAVGTGGAVTTIAGNGGVGSDDNTNGLQARFNHPSGIAIAAGNIYVADKDNHKIRKLSFNNNTTSVSTIAGNGTQAFADNQIGLSASFNQPKGMIADANGNLFVADYGNNCIRKISFKADNTTSVSTIAGSTTAGYADGKGSQASFNQPTGLRLDAAGNIYVTDYGNNRIRKITFTATDTIVSTIAGSSTAGYADGKGLQARFKNPHGIVSDAAGNLYVTDIGNFVIRKITFNTTDTIVSSFAGNQQLQSYSDGIGSNAAFNNPQGIAIDATGNLYVTDCLKNRIRKIVSGKYGINPVLPAGLNFNTLTGIISGTPTVASPQTNYTISAINKNGVNKLTISITVQ